MFAKLPPALALVVVLMIDTKAGPLDHRPNPGDAVVAVVFVLLKVVFDQKSLGWTIVHVASHHGRALRHVIALFGRLFRQGMPPVFHHSFESLDLNQLCGMSLCVLGDGLGPIFLKKLLAAGGFQPGKCPFVMSTEVVCSNHRTG